MCSAIGHHGAHDSTSHNATSATDGANVLSPSRRPSWIGRDYLSGAAGVQPLR